MDWLFSSSARVMESLQSRESSFSGRVKDFRRQMLAYVRPSLPRTGSDEAHTQEPETESHCSPVTREGSHAAVVTGPTSGQPGLFVNRSPWAVAVRRVRRVRRVRW
ncbi:uncharacterized protein AB9W97_012933 isoform 1-T4 [Spinachia spinachia]